MTAIACALLILSGVPAAPTGPEVDESSLVFHGDFEAGRDVNYDAWPDGWTRRRGRGYPSYVGMEIVDDPVPASAANRCLRISMDGGAAEVFTPALPVAPCFNYVLNARLRSEGLKHDIVTLAVAFFDEHDRLLESSESSAIRQAPQWTEVRLGPIQPSHDQLRYAVLSVHVRPTDAADLKGQVYIDDVKLERLPRITLDMHSDHHIYPNPQDVKVTCRVSGYATGQPRIKFELLDVHGNVLDSADKSLSEETAGRVPPGSGDSPTGFSGSTDWKPNVPGYGYYSIRFSTVGHVGWQRSLAVVPSLQAASGSEFGWSLPHGERPFKIRSLPQLLTQAGLGWVKFPVWYSPQDKQRAEEVAWLVERLGAAHVRLVGVLDQPPADIKSSFGSAEWIPAASLFAERAVWYPAVEPILTRLSLTVRWWQFGRDDDTSFSSLADVDGRVRAIRDDLASFGQEVKVGFPWRTLDEPPGSTSPAPSWSFVSYGEPLTLTPAETRAYFDRPEMSSSDRWVMLQALPAGRYDLSTRIQDLVQQILAAKISQAKGIILADPFHPAHGVMNGDGTPNELFLPWRTAASLLGGMEHLGSLKLPGGSRNHVFARGAEGLMVVWRNEPGTERLYLGEKVRVFDVWGREFIPEERKEDGFEEQTFPVGPLPVFVTGVDPAVAAWRMHFRLETDRLASVFGQQQQVSYRFRNTFPHPIGGRVIAELPGARQTELSARNFKLAPGEEHQASFRVTLGTDVSSGTQPLRIEFDVSAGREIHFRLNESLEIGLGDVMVELNSSLDAEGNLVVKQDLINTTTQNVSFNCLLFVPDRRREKRQIFHLGQGRTTSTFVLPNGKELAGKTLWLRAEEINGIRIINEKLVVRE